jgi:hypothetical protein
MSDPTDQAPEPEPDEDMESTRDAPRVHAEDPAEGPRTD